MSSVFWFVIVFYVAIAQAINSSQSSQPDGEAWGIRTCVIQHQVKTQTSYGCQFEEINEEDYTSVENQKCMPKVGTVRIQDRGDDDLVTVTFFMDTPNNRCRKNRNKTRGVVVELHLSNTDYAYKKIFSLKTKNRIKPNVKLPSLDNGVMVQAFVYPIQLKTGDHSFTHPMTVGSGGKHNLFIKKKYTTEVPYICKCEDVIVTTNSTISLKPCSSPNFDAATVTRQGDSSICTPTNKSSCEENYSNLVDGVYTVLTYFKCKHGETRECQTAVNIWTPKENIHVIPPEDTIDVNKVLMIAGISTGGAMAFVVVLTYGLLKHRLHKGENDRKKRELRLRERNDILLVYFDASGLKNKIEEFAETLKKATRLPVHFPDDEASQRQRFTNKFDWLDECVRNSSNFVFIASKDLYDLLENKCKGNANEILHSTGNHEVELNNEQTWLAGIPCHVMDRIRGKRFYGLKRSRCFIVSFKDDENGSKIDYGHKLSQLSVFQCKWTKLHYVSQKRPMTITRKFLYELHGNKRTGLSNVLDPEEHETLLPAEGNDEAIETVV